MQQPKSVAAPSRKQETSLSDAVRDVRAVVVILVHGDREIVVTKDELHAVTEGAGT